MQEIRTELIDLSSRARAASGVLARLSTGEKNQALLLAAEALVAGEEEILRANREDLSRAEAAGTSRAMLDRLKLTSERISQIANGARKVAALPDPIGLCDGWKHENGMEILRTRVPLGVIGIIYEARPNVTVDAAALALKSANAVILRGGKEALNTNVVLVRLLKEALSRAGLPQDAVNLIASTDRAYTNELLSLSGHLDAVIPRGGAGLIRFVKESSRVPVIETGAGNCHLYVHADADLSIAENVLVNAKVSRPSVCNAVEHLLIHREIAPVFLPRAIAAMKRHGVVVRACAACRAISPELEELLESDFETEFNDLVLSVKIVEDLKEATDHINRYGTRHSETIITESLSASEDFAAAVDAACVYTNASSRFTDGEEFGFGAEIGISTQKLHARGPMGLRELTCVKYIIRGRGQIRA